MRFIGPLAEPKKHLKSWFLAIFYLLSMFWGLLSCLFLICSSKHIFWYQIYGCMTLRSWFMARKVSNLVIFCQKIGHGRHIKALFTPKTLTKPLYFALILLYTLWASFWYLIHACGCLRSPEIQIISHPMVKNWLLGQSKLKRVAFDQKNIPIVM